MLHWLQLVSLANTPASSSQTDSENRTTRTRSCRTQERSVPDAQILVSWSRQWPSGIAQQSTVGFACSSFVLNSSCLEVTRGKGGKKDIDKTKCPGWKTSVSISRNTCVRRVPNARESTAASVVVAPSHTTNAIASNKRSRACPAPLPVSSVPSLVNDGSPAHRILLVTSHNCHERDLLKALRDGAEQKSRFVFELVFFDLEHATDFLWFSLCSIAYDRATSRRCTWCRQPQRGRECVTALFPAIRIALRTLLSRGYSMSNPPSTSSAANIASATSRGKERTAITRRTSP